MAKKKRERAPKKWIIVTAIVVGICFFLVILSLVLYNKKQITPASVSTQKANVPVHNKVTVGGKGTPEYNANLKELGEIEAAAARKQGKSYITPVIGSDPGQTKKKAKTKSVRNFDQPPPPTPRQPTSAPSPDPYAETMKKAIEAELGQIVDKLKFSGHDTKIFGNREEQRPTTSSGALLPAKGKTENYTDRPGTLPIIPGDVLYAINNQTLNSDIPAHAGTATILSGKFKDSRLIGKFKRYQDHLLLEYSQMILPDGTRYKIEGYAVDPDTTSVAVRSKADHHYLTRWGGLIAASFLEGFGEAVKNDGTVETLIYDGGISTVKQYPEYDLSDQAWIAAGKVAERLASKADTYFNRPPTVILNSGTPIGILIINIERKV